MFEMECSMGSVSYPSIDRVPDFIDSMLKTDGGTQYIRLVNTDDELATGTFQREMNDLKGTWFKHYGYEGVYTSTNGKIDDTSFYRGSFGVFKVETEDDTLKITKSSVEDLVEHMSDYDIAVNESLGDRAKLNRVSSYEERMNSL